MKSQQWNKVWAGFLLTAGLALWALDERLNVSHYELTTSKVQGKVRLVYLSDLHGSQYGQGQSELLNAIEQVSPDLILLGGDIFDHRVQVQPSLDLVDALVDRYPICYVTGNHEFQHAPTNAVKQRLRFQGIHVLDGRSMTIDIKGNPITLMGVDDPYVGEDAYLAQVAELHPSDHYSILLTHRPERMADFEYVEADLVLAGHAHGGQWRIPFVNQGVYAPHQGIWPQYTSGLHEFGSTKLIVSRGLTTDNTRVPRIFNRPEMLVIDISGK